MPNTQSKKKSADPLPYIITFAILFLIALGVLTWVLDVFYKSYSCAYYPNIWCSDNWTCQTTCTGGIIPGTNGLLSSPCFGSPGSTGTIGPTGLASCLFGPGATGAQICYYAPTGGPPTGGNALSCDCPSTMQGSNVLNCFNGCGLNLGSVLLPDSSGSGSPVCCCNIIGNPSCAIDSNGNPTGPCAGSTT